MNIAESYNHFFASRSFERADLIQKIVEQYDIQSGLYPGSYTHVTPSFFIPHMVYVDADPKAKKIFSDMDAVQDFIRERKQYPQEAAIAFYGQSYADPIPVGKGQFDLLISQYAGPISQDCKSYLKPGGILLVNNSHADAGVAALDPDYTLIAIAQNGKGDMARISNKSLDEYFIPKKETYTLPELRALGKGIAYTKTASNYIFQLT